MVMALAKLIVWLYVKLTHKHIHHLLAAMAKHHQQHLQQYLSSSGMSSGHAVAGTQSSS